MIFFCHRKTFIKKEKEKGPNGGPTLEVQYKEENPCKACLAKLTIKFSNPKMWENAIVAKPEEIERMSETMPMISLDRLLPEITLMSVELSEKAFSDEYPRDFAMPSA